MVDFTGNTRYSQNSNNGLYNTGLSVNNPGGNYPLFNFAPNTSEVFTSLNPMNLSSFLGITDQIQLPPQEEGVTIEKGKRNAKITKVKDVDEIDKVRLAGKEEDWKEVRVVKRGNEGYKAVYRNEKTGEKVKVFSDSDNEDASWLKDRVKFDKNQASFGNPVVNSGQTININNLNRNINTSTPPGTPQSGSALLDFSGGGFNVNTDLAASFNSNASLDDQIINGRNEDSVNRILFDYRIPDIPDLNQNDINFLRDGDRD